MTPARYATALLLLLIPAVVRGQIAGTSIEIFGTAGAIAGLTPVKVAAGSRVAAHGGLRLDGGMQLSHIGFGVGLRYWEMAPTNEYGGRGLDGFVFAEVRPGNSLRTTIRGAFGTGFTDFDSSDGTLGSTITLDANIWSVGVGHELIVPFGAHLNVSADVIVSRATPGPIGRRSPVLEFGIGYRFRNSHPIGPMRTRHR